MPDSTDRRLLQTHSTHPADDAPSLELEWSDALVGMGFFPEEVELPAGWTWEANRVTR